VITMKLVACKSYHAQKAGQSVYRMPDGKSVFKVYFISIIKRDTPERFEWERSPMKQADFEKVFLAGGHEGLGFVIAFPHIAKIFRFSPYVETVLDVNVFNTESMSHRDCSRVDGSHEFACYAEAVIAAGEYHAWAKAATVNDYLAYRCDDADFPVVSNTKLAEYWGGGA